MKICFQKFSIQFVKKKKKYPRNLGFYEMSSYLKSTLAIKFRSYTKHKNAVSDLFTMNVQSFARLKDMLQTSMHTSKSQLKNYKALHRPISLCCQKISLNVYLSNRAASVGCGICSSATPKIPVIIRRCCTAKIKFIFRRIRSEKKINKYQAIRMQQKICS